jgi:predicted RNA-binding Zn-ribbon protein involved in translation (DUF1610 family)
MVNREVPGDEESELRTYRCPLCGDVDEAYEPFPCPKDGSEMVEVRSVGP